MITILTIATTLMSAVSTAICLSVMSDTKMELPELRKWLLVLVFSMTFIGLGIASVVDIKKTNEQIYSLTHPESE